MVVAMRAVLISFFVLLYIFAEYLLALLACEDEFHGLLQLVIFAPQIFVAVWAVEPLLAAWCSDCNLSIHNMFAHFSVLFK